MVLIESGVEQAVAVRVWRPEVHRDGGGGLHSLPVTCHLSTVSRQPSAVTCQTSPVGLQRRESELSINMHAELAAGHNSTVTVTIDNKTNRHTTSSLIYIVFFDFNFNSSFISFTLYIFYATFT